MGVRGVRPTFFAAAALSCGGRGLESPPGGILGVTELDGVERVEVFVAVRARTCCFGPW